MYNEDNANFIQPFNLVPVQCHVCSFCYQLVTRQIDIFKFVRAILKLVIFLSDTLNFVRVDCVPVRLSV